MNSNTKQIQYSWRVSCSWQSVVMYDTGSCSLEYDAQNQLLLHDARVQQIKQITFCASQFTRSNFSCDVDRAPCYQSPQKL